MQNAADVNEKRNLLIITIPNAISLSKSDKSLLGRWWGRLITGALPPNFGGVRTVVSANARLGLVQGTDRLRLVACKFSGDPPSALSCGLLMKKKKKNVCLILVGSIFQTEISSFYQGNFFFLL
jgi:hypothetical protein